MIPASNTFEQFTLGIEEEFQIVDPIPASCALMCLKFSKTGKMLLGEQVKPEMIQSMIEVGTGICKDIKDSPSRYHKPSRGILSRSGAQEGPGDRRCRHSSVLALAGPEDLRQRQI